MILFYLKKDRNYPSIENFYRQQLIQTLDNIMESILYPQYNFLLHIWRISSTVHVSLTSVKFQQASPTTKQLSISPSPRVSASVRPKFLQLIIFRSWLIGRRQSLMNYILSAASVDNRSTFYSFNEKKSFTLVSLDAFPTQHETSPQF